MPRSGLARLGGVCSLVGGVDASDSPDEPAVEGLPSTESFLTADFFLAGTPSGHVHCTKKLLGHQQPLEGSSYISLAVRTAHAIWLRLITLYVVS